MTRWRRHGQVWCLWPSNPIGLIEMIGGSYLATTPQISYRRLLEELSLENLAIHAWGYLPALDHQSQANQAWRDLRNCREKLVSRVGTLPLSLRLGHSLGCKLHLLAPDGGRNSTGLVAMSFNNFAANNSIPGLKKIAPKMGFQSEFSPSPKETLRLIQQHYLQPRNLLVSFGEDSLDQSPSLLQCLNKRFTDESKTLHLAGDHLTPASAGLRKKLLGGWADDSSRNNSLKLLRKAILNWSES